MAAVEAEVLPVQQLTEIEDYQFLGDNWTVERKRTFIVNYREHGSIYHAAKLTPVSRQSVYNWMEQDQQFSLAVEESKEDSVDELETSVYKRAFTNDLLAMFYLKAHRPKFRDRVSVDVEVVRTEIEERMQQLNLRQLPPAMMNPLVVEAANNLQIPHPSEDLQKEDQSE